MRDHYWALADVRESWAIAYSYTGYVYHKPHGGVERAVARCVNSQVVERLEMATGAESPGTPAAESDSNLAIARWIDDRDFDDGFLEGRVVWRLHRSFERSPLLAEAKKQEALNRGDKLDCYICKFDFFRTYGEVGTDFIECHHKTPLSELREERVTLLKDVILVCSNCHRMLHRSRPKVHTPEELQALVLKSCGHT